MEFCVLAVEVVIKAVNVAGALPEPSCHKMLQTVYCGRGNSRFLVGLSDANVKRGEALVFPGHINARLQVGVVNCKTLYDLQTHNN